jgi:hypothetical protein
MPDLALVTCDAMVDGFPDDEELARVLQWRGHRVDIRSWSDPGTDWAAYDLAVLRTTWDYSTRHEEFLGWLRACPARVLNDPALVVWNSDKRYLQDLAAAGLPVVPTTFVAPGEPAPALGGEVVVKPTVSAGSRLTGRFSPQAHDEARVLLAAIAAVGKTAMVQPFLAAVDRTGETDIVLIDGVPSHAMRKGPVLRPDEVAPVVPGGGQAQAMLDPDLVAATTPGGAVRGDAAGAAGGPAGQPRRAGRPRGRGDRAEPVLRARPARLGAPGRRDRGPALISRPRSTATGRRRCPARPRTPDVSPRRRTRTRRRGTRA